MFKILLTFIFILNLSAQVSASQVSVSETETWNSKEGLKRLERSQFKNDFYQLINFYQPQINPLYCAAATGTIILNAFYYGNIPSQDDAEIIKPQEIGGGRMEFNEFLQKDFFNKKTNKIKDQKIIDLVGKNDANEYDPGVSLFDFSRILSEIYNLKTEISYAEKLAQIEVENFRNKVKEVLLDSDNFIIVNFDGKILGKETGGHISLLAAYDKMTDSVLIMDVALHKNLWYFVTINNLYKAMNSKDGGNYRGYLTVKKYD